MCILDKILKTMKEKHITQKMLTEQLGLSKSSFSSWKSGANESYKKYLPEIAKFLSVSVSYLTGESSTPTLNSSEPNDNDIKFALFNGADGITDEMFNEVKQFAEMVKLREEAKKNKK